MELGGLWGTENILLGVIKFCECEVEGCGSETDHKMQSQHFAGN